MRCGRVSNLVLTLRGGSMGACETVTHSSVCAGTRLKRIAGRIAGRPRFQAGRGGPTQRRTGSAFPVRGFASRSPERRELLKVPCRVVTYADTLDNLDAQRKQPARGRARQCRRTPSRDHERVTPSTPNVRMSLRSEQSAGYDDRRPERLVVGGNLIDFSWGEVRQNYCRSAICFGFPAVGGLHAQGRVGRRKARGSVGRAATTTRGQDSRLPVRGL